MAQQLLNGSNQHGDVTITVRDTYRYAVVNPPFQGKHRKPQTDAAKARRKAHWRLRSAELREKVKRGNSSVLR